MSTDAANLDGMIHRKGGDCCTPSVCPLCKGREHYQATYGNYMTLCEACPNDAGKWNDDPSEGLK